MTLIKPKLVDYDLIKFPQKKASKIQQKIVKQDNTKFYINLFMIFILCIGGYVLYHRMTMKEQVTLENNANLLFLHQYITETLTKTTETGENEENKINS
tara:strand:+ start:1095 stop:1391 length:297 start_codon:yes stop_codon:yes gene_type:complete